MNSNKKNSITNMYKILHNATFTKGKLNDEEIIKLMRGIINEITSLEDYSTDSISKEILNIIIEKSSDFEDFKEKYTKFSKIEKNNKNYEKKMESYFKNVLKININNNN